MDNLNYLKNEQAEQDAEKSEKMCICLKKSDALSILMFLSFHSDEVNQTSEFAMVKEAKANFQKQIGKQITDEDFDSWRQEKEIYSIFKK